MCQLRPVTHCVGHGESGDKASLGSAVLGAEEGRWCLRRNQETLFRMKQPLKWALKKKFFQCNWMLSGYFSHCFRIGRQGPELKMKRCSLTCGPLRVPKSWGQYTFLMAYQEAPELFPLPQILPQPYSGL